MYKRWVVDEDYDIPDIPPAEDPQYTLTVATTGTIEPWSFYVGTSLKGYDIELAKRFASWLGAGLNLKVYDFGGVISAAQSGDADCIMSNLYYMPEYTETLDFSDPLMTVEITAMVKDSSSAKAEGGFLQWIRNSFKRTFLTEDRWELFVSGAVTTLIITAASILLGALLGFIAYNICRGGGRAANTITRFTVWLVQGMPAVVLLMLLYYVVFGRVTIPGTIVSVMAFSLIFGATVYQRIKEGMAAIDIGQQMLPRTGILPAHIIAEYSKEDGKATVTISYSGERFDPADTDNKMSYDMLKMTVQDISYSYDPEAEIPNTGTVLI